MIPNEQFHQQLRTAVLDAVHSLAWADDRIVTGVIGLVLTNDDDGPGMFTIVPPDQLLSTSLGMVSWLDKIFDTDAREVLASFLYGDDDDE